MLFAPTSYHAFRLVTVVTIIFRVGETRQNTFSTKPSETQGYTIFRLRSGQRFSPLTELNRKSDL